MGQIVDQAVVAVGHSSEWRQSARRWAHEAEDRLQECGGVVIGPVMAVNNVCTVALLPCGSKVGWGSHEAWEEMAEDLIARADARDSLGLPLAKVVWHVFDGDE